MAEKKESEDLYSGVKGSPLLQSVLQNLEWKGM